MKNFLIALAIVAATKLPVQTSQPTIAAETILTDRAPQPVIVSADQPVAQDPESAADCAGFVESTRDFPNR